MTSSRFRASLARLGVVVLVFAATIAGQAASAPPSIVLILADDLAYADLSSYGGTIPTPHIDSLARDGVRFTRFYASAPECSPSRTALLTGRYPQRVGGMECAIGTGNVGRYDDAIRLRAQNDLGLPVAENTLVAGLKQAGYRTVVSGKWHLGYEPKFSPVAHGFDASFGPNAGGVDYFHHTEWDGVPALFENGQPVKRDGYLTDLITEFGEQAIARRPAGRPLFLYLPYTAPHTPYQGPGDKPSVPVLEPDWNKGTRDTYAAMVRSLDAGVGRILAALEQHGLRDNTLVIFTSDNGGTALAQPGPFSGTKGTLHEGGIRVPCLVRWPGQLPAGVISTQTAITMDLTRSILRVAGAPAGTRRFDGIDVLDHVAQRRADLPRQLYWRYRRGDLTWRAALDGDLKLIHRQEGAGLKRQLFDLRSDPAEKNDLLATRPAEAARLESALQAWQTEVKPVR